MRTIVLADIHANLTALEAVIADAGSFDRVFCMGDIVGYGPDPDACISLIRGLPNLHVVMGNHDAAICGLIEVGNFNPDARRALEIQRKLISPQNFEWLELLEVEKQVDEQLLVHGSPRNPIWEYMLSSLTALENFEIFSSPVCLLGHTHVPSIFELQISGGIRLLLPTKGDLWSSKNRFLLNPGSVGQPRDNDPRAAYLIFDDTDRSWQFHRVRYAITRVQERMRALGLPARHIERLEKGV